MATKYVPQNLFGGSAANAVVDVFTPAAGTNYVLTEIIAANRDTSTRTLSVGWSKSGTTIWLFSSTPIAPKSLVNLNLYLPIDQANNVRAFADAANQVDVTINGLKLETI